MESMAVDHVYTWVNSRDEVVSRRRTDWANKLNGTDLPYRTGVARVADNGELKASLANAQKFLPFVRHTYIVGSGDPPSWILDFEGSVTYVHQEEILPDHLNPIFQSDAVEAFIHRIPGLSEHYLYSNDDFFFAVPHSAEDFFPCTGKTKVGLAPWAAATGAIGTYRSMEENSVKALRRHTRLPSYRSGYPRLREGLRLKGRLKKLLPMYVQLAVRGLRPVNAIAHVTEPYLKSAWSGFHQEFAGELSELCAQKFRSDSGVCVNFMYHYYAHHIGVADFYLAHGDRLLQRFDGEHARESFKREVLSQAASVKRFCLNDTPIDYDDHWDAFVTDITSTLLAQERVTAAEDISDEEGQSKQL